MLSNWGWMICWKSIYDLHFKNDLFPDFCWQSFEASSSNANLFTWCKASLKLFSFDNDAIFVSRHPRGLLLGNCPLRGPSSVELERVRCSDVPHESSNFFFGAPKVVPWNTGHCQPHRLFQKMSDLKLALDLATEAPPARKGTWYSWQSTLSEKTASQVRRPCARFF